MWNHGVLITSFLFIVWFHALMCNISNHHVEGIFKENIESFGEKLTNALITIATCVSLKDCIILCQRRPRCLSINFMQSFQMCELNYLDKSHSNSIFVTNPAVLYSEKKSWKKRTRDPCSKRTCKIYEECVEDNVGQTSCVIADCGLNLPNVTNAIGHADNGIGVYSKVTYHCEDSYSLKGKPYIGCQTDGVWSPRRFKCLKVLEGHNPSRRNHDLHYYPLPPKGTDIECQDSWTKFQTSCYNITPKFDNWNAQKSYCNSVGAMLAEVTSQNEQDFVVNLLNKNGLTDAWIGGSDFDIEGTWKWTNSNTIFWSSNNVPADAYYTWYPGKPDDAFGRRNCLLIYSEKWIDRRCSRIKKGICEKNIQS